ncbi:MAG: phosphoheptose isomerase [Thiotrichales bacterium]|nr:MAG: phosphoheptose isomerase [Thiotrichales bacterium]
MKSYIEKQLSQSIELQKKVYADKALQQQLITISELCVKAYKNGRKILAAGNGGSAADSQHLIAELVSRFFFHRKALAAQALSVNTSTLTAIGNDYGYDQLFSRQIEANAKAGDIFLAISTSGNSVNIIKAAETAKKQGVIVIGLTGETGGELKKLCDVCLCVPSKITPRIQETHILLGHIICATIEEEMFADEK